MFFMSFMSEIRHKYHHAIIDSAEGKEVATLSGFDSMKRQKVQHPEDEYARPNALYTKYESPLEEISKGGYID